MIPSPFFRRVAVLLAYFPAMLLPASADEKASGAAKTLAAAVQPFVDKHTLAGAVMLVADKDNVLTIATVGYAEVATQSMMGQDSLFWIASESKPITAALLMMLVDEGKLKLDDPVEKYLPEFKDLMVADQDKKLKKPNHAITIREVLSHTSGMPFQSAAERPALDKLTLQDAAQSYAKTPLQSEPVWWAGPRHGECERISRDRPRCVRARSFVLGSFSTPFIAVRRGEGRSRTPFRGWCGAGYLSNPGFGVLIAGLRLPRP